MGGFGSARHNDRVRAELEASCSLDVNSLHRAGALARGRLGVWRWTYDGEDLGGIRIRAEAGRVILSYRFRNSDGVSEDVRDIVDVVRKPRPFGASQRFFLCPGIRGGVVCGRRVVRLYGIGGYFRCRHCCQRAYAPDSGWQRRRPVGQLRKVRAYAALAGCGAIAASAQALASGFMVRENSAAGVATVYAGNGSRANAPDTVFANPAGMTRLISSEVEFGSAVIFPSVKFNGGASVAGAPIPSSDGGNSGLTAVIPNMSWVFKITDRLRGGIAVTVPFGNASEYKETWPGRYLGIKTSALSADINPAIAYKITDGFAIGAGVSAQYLKLEASSAIAQFLIFGPGTADGLYSLKADDWAFGYNVGALVELGGETRVGVTYRSRIDHRIKGELDFTGVSPFLGLVNGPASADVHLPATSGFSITQDVSPNLSVSADVQFTQWSVFKQVIIESQNLPFIYNEGYRDSWMVSLGGVYRLNDRLALRAGLGWDQTPITDRYRTVSLPDEDRYMVGIGFGYKLLDWLSLDGAYQHSFALTHADMNNSINNTDPITHAVVLNGKYDVGVDIVALSVRFKY